MDEAVDGGERHCWSGKTFPQSPNGLIGGEQHGSSL